MFQKIKNAKTKIGAGVAMMAASAASFAQATATTDIGVEAINGLSATATSYITAAFGVAVLVAGGFWGISMMKKAYGKAG